MKEGEKEDSMPRNNQSNIEVTAGHHHLEEVEEIVEEAEEIKREAINLRRALYTTPEGFVVRKTRR